MGSPEPAHRSQKHVESSGFVEHERIAARTTGPGSPVRFPIHYTVPAMRDAAPRLTRLRFSKEDGKHE